MASKDIDGSIIVILTKEEALQVYNRLVHILRSGQGLTECEQKLIYKIARDLELRKEKNESKS